MSSPIANLYASLHYRVDNSGLRRFEKQLKDSQRRINSSYAQNVSHQQRQTRLVANDYKTLTNATNSFRNNAQGIGYAYQSVGKSAVASTKLQLDGLKKLESSALKLQDKVEIAEQKIAYRRGKRNVRLLGNLTRVEKKYDRRTGQLAQMRKEYSDVNREFARGNIGHEQRNRLLADMAANYSVLKRQQVDYNKQYGRPVGGTHNAVNPAATARESDLKPYAAGALSGAAVENFKGGTSSDSDSRRRRNTTTTTTDDNSVKPVPAVASVGMGAAVGAGIAAAGTGMVANASQRAYQDMLRMEQRYTILEGSQEEGKARIREIAAIANELGQPLIASLESYASVANQANDTVLEGKEIETFKAIIKNSTAYGSLPQESLKLVDLIGKVAGNQSMSGDDRKELVNAGITPAFIAQAMGVPLEEFLERLSQPGGIDAKKVLPYLVQVLDSRSNIDGALDRAKATSDAERQRRNNQAVEASYIANSAGLDELYKKMAIGMREALKAAEPLFIAIGEFAEKKAPAVRDGVEQLGELFGAIGNVADSFDGVDVELPFITLNDILETLTDTLNGLANTVDFLRDDANTFKEKAGHLGDILINALKGVVEVFVNAAITRVNFLLPKSLEIDPISLSPTNEVSPEIDLSGVEALVGEAVKPLKDLQLLPQMKSAETDTTKYIPSPKMQEMVNSVNDKAERFRQSVINQGSPINVQNTVDLSGANALLNNPQPPVNNTNTTNNNANNTTVNQNNNTTIHIDGAQQPEQILGTIEDHINGLMRVAATGEPTTER